MSEDAALVACLMEIERHIAAAGWEQPAQLFALVPSSVLAEAEPGLADVGPTTDDPSAAEDRLSAIGQDDFDPGDDLLGALAQIMWPDAVWGCALSLVRSFLPAGAEADIPDEPGAAEAYVQAHPERQDVRAVVGVLRDGVGSGGVGSGGMGGGGTAHSVARLARHPDDLLAGPDLMPGVTEALRRTFDPGPS